MAGSHSFRAVILNAGGGGAYVEVPFDVEEAFGSKRPKVAALIEGVPYRGTLVRMGTECHILPVLKGIREQVGKSFGDTVKVTVEADLAPRVVKLPPDLARAFRNEMDAHAYFKTLAYTNRKEYVRYVTEAKRAETRATRILKTIALLKKRRRSP